jgi:thiol-disulfide isomerase/thioredoxin
MRTLLRLSLAMLAMLLVGMPGGARTSGAAVPSSDLNSGVELLGTRAPAWRFDRWLRTRPLTLPELHGKVVLVRWWTEGCPYCETTLPAIEALRHRHGDDFVVIGVFHPKPPGNVSDARVLAAARRLGFDGPIAVDPRWAMLRRWWLDADPSRGWTSVSFLVDRDGVIRWVHGGGEYHPSRDPEHASCDARYHELERAIAAALTRRVTGT